VLETVYRSSCHDKHNCQWCDSNVDPHTAVRRANHSATETCKDLNKSFPLTSLNTGARHRLRLFVISMGVNLFHPTGFPSFVYSFLFMLLPCRETTPSSQYYRMSPRALLPHSVVSGCICGSETYFWHFLLKMSCDYNSLEYSLYNRVLA